MKVCQKSGEYGLLTSFYEVIIKKYIHEKANIIFSIIYR